MSEYDVNMQLGELLQVLFIERPVASQVAECTLLMRSDGLCLLIFFWLPVCSVV